jgi:prepilin-type N-terminal cleavage/methylation domain-containing protein
MRKRYVDSRGFTLIEIVIVIVVICIIATVMMRQMNETIETARYEQTKREMQQIVRAMVGNPDTYTSGTRVDFGYVGDVGALPPNLDALVTRPGGYATWNGPYLTGSFESQGHKRDAWGVLYTYTDTLLRSTGSGGNIDKLIAASNAVLTSNTISGYISDANREAPRGTYADSVVVSLVHPDGLAALAVAATTPNGDGHFTLSGIPIGNHTLKVVFTPESDTMTYQITVLPGKDVNLEIVFPADLW